MSHACFYCETKVTPGDNLGRLDRDSDLWICLDCWKEQHGGDDSVRRCRECGCSELDACESEYAGPCAWVEADLCSACRDALIDDVARDYLGVPK